MLGPHFRFDLVINLIDWTPSNQSSGTKPVPLKPYQDDVQLCLVGMRFEAKESFQTVTNRRFIDKNLTTIMFSENFLQPLIYARFTAREN